MLHFDIDCVTEWFVMKQKETYRSVISAPVLINITELPNNCNSCQLHVKKNVSNELCSKTADSSQQKGVFLPMLFFPVMPMEHL